MTSRKFIFILILILSVTGLSACGGGGGGGGGGTGIVLTPSKTVALADGIDTVTVVADVRNPNGSPAADGTAVTFSASDSSGPLGTSTAVTSNGSASYVVSHAPITGARNSTVTVSASGGGNSGTTDIKFINQPASVDVFIAFDQAVTNLAGLQFNLISTPGATFDNNAQPIFAINNAAQSLTLPACHFDAATGTTSIGLANATGFDTGTDPIVKITFGVTTGLPSFSTDPAPANFTAVSDTSGSATSPPVTAANIVVTVKYDTEN